MARKQSAGKYKIKTHKATSKRFRLTGSGMLVRTKGGKSHFRRRTSKRTKRLLDEMIPVKGRGIVKSVHRLAPYMKKANSLSISTVIVAAVGCKQQVVTRATGAQGFAGENNHDTCKDWPIPPPAP